MARKIKTSHRLLLALALVAGSLEEKFRQGHCAYRSGKLFFWTPPGYERKNYYESLWRLLRTRQIEKTIEKGKPVLRFTSEGQKLFERNFNLFKWQRKKWDKKWRLVIFDLPEKESGKRNALRKKLTNLGFGQWQRSVYVSPYDFIADLIDFLKKKNLLGFAWVLTAKHEHLPQPKALANEIWCLDKLNSKYAKLFEQIKKRQAEPAREDYNDYIEILLEDPLLPVELLPQPWWGNRVRQALT